MGGHHLRYEVPKDKLVDWTENSPYRSWRRTPGVQMVLKEDVLMEWVSRAIKAWVQQYTYSFHIDIMSHSFLERSLWGRLGYTPSQNPEDQQFSWRFTSQSGKLLSIGSRRSEVYRVRGKTSILRQVPQILEAQNWRRYTVTITIIAKNRRKCHKVWTKYRAHLHESVSREAYLDWGLVDAKGKLMLSFMWSLIARKKESREAKKDISQNWYSSQHTWNLCVKKQVGCLVWRWKFLKHWWKSCHKD